MSCYIAFANRQAASANLSNMKVHILRDGSLSIQNAAAIVGYPLGYAKEIWDTYGWTDLSEARIGMDGRVFYLTLPDPTRLEQVESKTADKKETVNHPNHYQSEFGIEVIDVIKAFTANLSGIEAWDTGSVIKYVCRWKEKNGLEDLKKAKWYLEDLIEHVEKNQA